MKFVTSSSKYLRGKIHRSVSLQALKMDRINTEKYTAALPEIAELGFTPKEHGLFHQFHAHDWENDQRFQEGLKVIFAKRDFSVSEKDSTVLKAKQFYFSKYA